MDDPLTNEQEEVEESQEDQEHQEQEEDEHDESPPPRSPPSKLARLSPDDDPAAGLVTMAVASPLGLGLGLGLSVGEDTTTAAAAVAKSAFTFMQMQEFHHQSLIFKHMVAGITVPVHLILPIWKSVAASYGPHHYPSFVGLGNLCYDFRNSMEPEPGRCRRTDGKKWRCSRNVVPDQKYCERHMHRGRNRSRKTVEVPAVSTVSVAAASTTTAINLSISVPDTPGSVLSGTTPCKS